MMITNKKTLKLQYLKTTTRAGVYAIRNQVTGRAMVAGSTNVHGTLSRHRFELRYQQHRNVRLAQDWIEHGETNFLFEVLDMVKPNEDPAFNAAQELEMLVNLWRLEIPCLGELGYDGPRSEPR
ncbi:MAG: ArsR family transcriptional regulator [Herminiimonas sp.]|nr:ArsR family transcriptional regulator [Herminiimonas sp.]